MKLLAQEMVGRLEGLDLSYYPLPEADLNKPGNISNIKRISGTGSVLRNGIQSGGTYISLSSA